MVSGILGSFGRGCAVTAPLNPLDRDPWWILKESQERLEEAKREDFAATMDAVIAIACMVGFVAVLILEKLS